jgi:hypothetical protein
LYLQDVADPWKRRFGAIVLSKPRLDNDKQLLDLLRNGGYRFFIYDQDTGQQLYPQLAHLQFPGSHPAGLTPVFIPESSDFAVYRVLQDNNPALDSLDVTLDGIRLTGYESLLSEAQPRGSGQRLGVYLYWKDDRPLANRLKVFVHVINAKGEIAGQHDGEPQIGTWPTNEWQAGETVCDFHMVTFNRPLPPGTYSVRVGLYDEGTGKRLPVLHAGENMVVDDSIVVESLVIK